MESRQEPGEGVPASTLVGIFLLCCGTLVFELAFSKLVAVQGFGRLGDIAIGTALFGYALAGVLYLTSERIQGVPTEVLVPRCCLAAGLCMVLAHLVTSWVPLDFLRIFRDTPRVLVAAAIWYLALALPFFWASLAIVALLGEAGRGAQRLGRLYGADLVGAACGCLLTLVAIGPLGGAGILWFAGSVCTLAGGLFAWRASRRWSAGLGVLTLLLAAGAALVAPRIGIVVHASKRGFLEAQAAGQVQGTWWSAISRIDITLERQRQRIWFDGGSMQSRMPAPRAEMVRWEWEVLEITSMSLPYRLRQREQVAVLASSGGIQVHAALHFGAQHVTAVEVDPKLCELLTSTYDDYLEGLFTRPEVTLVNAEGRSYLRHCGRRFDVIQIISAHSDEMLATGAAGSYDSFLLTTEAILEFYERLTDDGVLYLGQGNAVRTFTQVLQALERGGIDPRGRIYYESGVQTLGPRVLLLRKTPFPSVELEVLAEHVRRSGSTVHFAPDAFWERLGPTPAGRGQDAALRPFLARVADLGGTERRAYLASLPFEALPATDDRPFFNRVFPFLARIPDPDDPRTPRVVQDDARGARRHGPVPISDVPPAVILVEAALLFLPVIALPWRRLRSRHGRERRAGVRSLLELLYFTGVGAGFVAVEIVLARRFVLFLGSPTVALAAVLGGLLLFAGAASAWLSPLLAGRRLAPGVLILLLVGTIVAYALGLDALFAGFRGTGLAARTAFGLLAALCYLVAALCSVALGRNGTGEVERSG